MISIFFPQKHFFHTNLRITNCTIILFLISYSCFSQPELKTYGVRINVTDMTKAVIFYTSTLGFHLPSGNEKTNEVILSPATGTEHIFLHKVSYLLPVGDKETTATLTLQVNNLHSTITFLKSKGVDFGKYVKRKEGVGYAIYIDDPFGTRISLMHETVVVNSNFEEPQIYNYGFYITDMEAEKNFYTKQLSFKIRSEKYLPNDLPLNHRDKSFAFMLHYRDKTEAIHYDTVDNEHIVILFQCTDINNTFTAFKNGGITLVKNKIENSAAGKPFFFTIPSDTFHK